MLMTLHTFSKSLNYSKKNQNSIGFEVQPSFESNIFYLKDK